MATRGQKKAGTETIGKLVYIHGMGGQNPAKELQFEWDLALFGREVRESVMAYWADILHPHEPPPSDLAARGLTARAARRPLDIDDILEKAGVDPGNADARSLANTLLRHAGVETGTALGAPLKAKIIPLPGVFRRPIARAFLERFIADVAAYLFKKGVREKIQKRLLDALPQDGTPVTLVAHSQGSIISLEVLHDLGKKANIIQYVTIGSPLGIQEVQDFLSCPTAVPAGVQRWNNYADPLDPVALDKGLRNDFSPPGAITDEMILNRNTSLPGFNPHSAVGYLAHPKVRTVVQGSIRFDAMARFIVARDVANAMSHETRHPVLIEILEPGNKAVGESLEDVAAIERAEGDSSLKTRISRAAKQIRALVPAAERGRVDELRRFVSASLTPTELRIVAEKRRDFRVYSIWKSSVKRKLLRRSVGVLQADAARASYGAAGEGVTWAVLDTGVRQDHPHFETHKNIVAVWDCTIPGKPPQLLQNFRDPDGHGSHVCGIIAGTSRAGDRIQQCGVAPRARLVVYKVLNEKGEGEDAWLIKALDHIAEQNENHSGGAIQGVNLSLGGPYDASVYGCGFTPLCAELRRLWRSGVVVCVACGNEGQLDVATPDGDTQINTPMSIGDPANLEDCIAVGSVNADKPHLYGISAFSSRGPTSDGRVKPDVVAPGERISSCNSRFTSAAVGADKLYHEESGTSMATPHVSGLVAAFLSVRREFRMRPDEVKAIMLKTCSDLGRDRYHQGHGLPNLMRMLLDV